MFPLQLDKKAKTDKIKRKSEEKTQKMTNPINLSKFPIRYARKVRCKLCGAIWYTSLPNGKIPTGCIKCNKTLVGGSVEAVTDEKEEL